MKQTKKYVSACEIANLTHNTQEELYSQLNQLGFYWNAKLSKWERNDTLADPPSDLIRIRVWADSEKLEDAVELLCQQMLSVGLNCKIAQILIRVALPNKQNPEYI